MVSLQRAICIGARSRCGPANPSLPSEFCVAEVGLPLPQAGAHTGAAAWPTFRRNYKGQVVARPTVGDELKLSPSQRPVHSCIASHDDADHRCFAPTQIKSMCDGEALGSGLGASFSKSPPPIHPKGQPAACLVLHALHTSHGLAARRHNAVLPDPEFRVQVQDKYRLALVGHGPDKNRRTHGPVPAMTRRRVSSDDVAGGTSRGNTATSTHDDLKSTIPPRPGELHQLNVLLRGGPNSQANSCCLCAPHTPSVPPVHQRKRPRAKSGTRFGGTHLAQLSAWGR